MKGFIKDLDNIYLSIILFIVGILMMIFPDKSSHIFIWSLGIVMLLRGILTLILALYFKDSEHMPGKFILYCVMGATILVLGIESINIIGVMWAVFSLQEIVEEIDQMWQEKHWSVIKLFLAAFSIYLAVTLMVHPSTHFVSHVRRLGLIIITSTLSKNLNVLRELLQSRKELKQEE